MKTVSFNLIAVGIFAAPVTALASGIPVTSYSMPNGGTGEFIYQDTTYSNCVASDCTTTGAALSGGTGRLTNGVIPTTDWYTSSNSAGWIGWDSGELNGANPTITFNFAQSETVRSFTFWYDDSMGYGDVTEPSSVSIDGNNFLVPTDTSAGPHFFTVSGLNLTGNSAQVQFFQGSQVWIMIGQVSFNGTTPVPLPAAGWFLLSGICGLGALARKRAA